jgi:hypothetical protein
MNLPRLFAVVLLALCPGLTALAGGKKGENSGISFHLQADPTDNPKMIFAQLTNGQQMVYRRNPEIMTKDIAAFNPFPSQDGEGYGVLLQLKPSAKNRFAAISNSSVNRWMVAMVNGRVVDAVIIDKQIDDGYLVIWKGIGQAEIEAFDALVPRIGESKPRR